MKKESGPAKAEKTKKTKGKKSKKGKKAPASEPVKQEEAPAVVELKE